MKVIGCWPFHDPGLTRIVWPWAGVPLSVGAWTFTGRPASAARTTAVAFEATVFEPSAFDAVTRTRRRRSTSAVATTYFVVVAPPIAAQSAPEGSPPPRGQRTHWYAKVVGEPVHEPWLAVSSEPTTALPLIRGSAVLSGAAFVTAPLPPGSASTVASDASAAAALGATVSSSRAATSAAHVSTTWQASKSPPSVRTR